MIAVIVALWPGLAAATLLGLLAGFASGLPRDRIGLSAAASLLVLLAVLAGLAVTEREAGDIGLWIDAAALMLAVYLVGCLAGALAKTLAVGER